MQNNTFVGNLAKAPVVSGSGDRAVCKFTLISNEYAGKDAEGNVREKAVALQFTAFGGRGKALAENTRKGCQVIVTYRIENNNYTKDGEEVYGYNFIVEDFAFGAPGKEKREELAQRG